MWRSAKATEQLASGRDSSKVGGVRKRNGSSRGFLRQAQDLAANPSLSACTEHSRSVYTERSRGIDVERSPRGKRSKSRCFLKKVLVGLPADLSSNWRFLLYKLK